MTAEPRYRYRVTCCRCVLYEGTDVNEARRMSERTDEKGVHVPMVERRSEVIYPYKPHPLPHSGRSS